MSFMFQRTTPLSFMGRLFIPTHCYSTHRDITLGWRFRSWLGLHSAGHGVAGVGILDGAAATLLSITTTCLLTIITTFTTAFTPMEAIGGVTIRSIAEAPLTTGRRRARSNMNSPNVNSAGPEAESAPVANLEANALASVVDLKLVLELASGLVGGVYRQSPVGASVTMHSVLVVNLADAKLG